MDRLARERDVIAVDLPGFGELAAARRRRAADARGARRAPSPTALGPTRPTTWRATRSAAGWRSSSRLAGRARAVTAIAPAGLWPEPLAPKRGVARALARAVAARRCPRSSAAPRGRRVALAAHGRPRRARAARGRAAARARLRRRARLRGGQRARCAPARFTRPGATSACRSRSRGPSTTGSSRGRRTCRRPSAASPLPGAGHVPMWDAPEAVGDAAAAGQPGLALSCP